MFCGNLFKPTNLLNHMRNHTIGNRKRIPPVGKGVFLSFSKEFEVQKLIPSIPDILLWSSPSFSKIVCWAQCEGVKITNQKENLKTANCLHSKRKF